MSDSVPASSIFTRYRRYLPGLVGAGAAALTSAYFGGNRASKAISRDSSRFVTWGGNRPLPSFKPKRPVTMRVARRTYRRRVRRVPRRSYVPRNLAGYTVLKGTSAPFPLTGAGAAPADLLGLQSFSISSVSNIANYTALYSKYKILRCTLQFVPRWDSGNPNTNGLVAVNGGTTQLISSFDDAATSVPANSAAVLTQSNCRIQNICAGRSVWLTCKPKPATTVQGINVGIQSEWLQTSNTTIPHYGFQTCLRNMTTAMTVDLYVTYTIAFAGRA